MERLTTMPVERGTRPGKGRPVAAESELLSTAHKTVITESEAH